MSSSYDQLHRDFSAYNAASSEDKKVLWKRILACARSGESGIDEDNGSDHCFLYTLTHYCSTPELAISFFQALTPLNKTKSLEWSNSQFGQFGGGDTVLMNAANVGFNKLVDAILDFGCDCNVLDENGNSALIHAAAVNNVYAVQALLTAGAVLDLANKKGSTALMAACRLGAVEGREDILRGLLEAGAGTDFEDEDGKTALDLAEAAGYEVASRLIHEFASRKACEELQSSVSRVNRSIGPRRV